MPHDDPVEVPERNAAGEHLAILCLEVLLSGNKDLRVRIELHELVRELLDQVIGHDIQRLMTETVELCFHSGSDHFKSLSCADLVRQKSITAVQHSRYRVELMSTQFDSRIHAVEHQPGAVILTRTRRVVDKVVLVNQRLTANRIAEDPHLESFCEGLLFLLYLRRSNRIFNALPRRGILCRDFERFQIQTCFKDLIGIVGVRSPLRARLVTVAVLPFARDFPLRELLVVEHLDILTVVVRIRCLERLKSKFLDVLRIDPCSAKPDLDVGSWDPLRLRLFQSFHISREQRILYGHCLGYDKFLAYFAREVFIGRNILISAVGTAFFRIREQRTARMQLRSEITGLTACQFRHVIQIDTGFFRERDIQRFLGRIGVCGRRQGLDRPLREDLRFRDRLLFLVDVFKRPKKVIRGLTREDK